jgi:hypothetical protein
MNERIKELIKQATECYSNGQERTFDKEKFAELIVRECCKVLEQTQDALDRQKWPTPMGCTEYIKEHFGVEP